MEKNNFKIELPKGDDIEVIESGNLTDNQYEIAVQLQQIQAKRDNLQQYVAELGFAQDHFRLKQKELIDLIENDDSTDSKTGQETD